MKKMFKFVLLIVIALFMSACSTVTHKVGIRFDTQPQGAFIDCGGKKLGLTPFDDNKSKEIIMSDEQMEEIKKSGKLSLTVCKAQWASGHEENFPLQVNFNDIHFVNEIHKTGDSLIKNYIVVRKVVRKKGKGYDYDVLVETRLKKMFNALNAYPNLIQQTKPFGAEIIYIDNGSGYNFNEAFDRAVLKGVLTIPKYKARWMSGYEMAFRYEINIDKEDPANLLTQTLVRPHTQGYDKDVQWGLELEKKRIWEENERKRTMAAQRQAIAAEQQASAAQQQALQMGLQTLQMQNQTLQMQQQTWQMQNQNQYLQNISNGVNSINNTMQFNNTMRMFNNW